MEPSNMTQGSLKSSIQIINASNSNEYIAYVFDNFSKDSVNYLNNQRYLDDKFILEEIKQPSSLKLMRLSQIYPKNSSLFRDLKSGNKLSRATKSKINNQFPTCISEINMLPFHHYYNLIQPKFVNDQGFYYVLVVKDGVIHKQIIDDKFYFQENTARICSFLDELEDSLWVHILIKVWAKLNSGYQNIKNSPPFQFIRAFSFPDWQVINPSKEKKEKLIAKISKASKNREYLIAKTKSNAKTGYYGFMPNCASFTINGHYQQYGNIYIKLTSFTNSHWNEIISDPHSKPPEQVPVLKQNQFIMPINQFINIFHLIYCTTNKYFIDAQPMNQIKNASSLQQNKQTNYKNPRKDSFNNSNRIQFIHYNKGNLSIDARQSNALVFGFQVQQKFLLKTHSGNHLNPSPNLIQVGLNLYFPKIKNFDIVEGRYLAKDPNADVVPSSKIIIGSLLDSHQTDVHFMQNVKQRMLYCEEEQIHFITHGGYHQFVDGQYFKGYAQELTFLLQVRPGKYLMRIKMEKQMSEYRCALNIVTINAMTKIYDPKVTRTQQQNLLKDCLFKKAAQDKKFITFVNPAKRGSWISCRDQYQTLGYSYIAVHVVKNADNKIIITVNPSVLKNAGYFVKGHKHSNKNNYTITVDSDQDTVIVLKYDKEWKGQKRIWPPPGIQFSKFPRKKN